MIPKQLPTSTLPLILESPSFNWGRKATDIDRMVDEQEFEEIHETPEELNNDHKVSFHSSRNKDIYCVFLDALCPGCNVEANYSKGVYVYKPARGSNSQTERPSKRRKVSKSKSSGDDDPLPFPRLLNGKETADSVKLRYATFQQLWSEEEDQIQVSCDVLLLS